MDGKHKKLLRHILMVMAPLLVLLSITIAWFVSSRTADLSVMSFASQGTGPGAVLHRAETLENRTFTPADEVTPATLTHDVTWGKEEAIDGSHITIEDMLPGQCAYFLLVSDHLFTPRLTNVELIDGDNPGEPTLAQCLGLYLIGTKLPANSDGTLTVEGATEIAEISLARNADTERLENVVFQNGLEGAALPIPNPAKKAYILAVYCDPIYGQNGESAPDTHVGTLPGAISFSLTFDKVGGAP